MAEHQLNFVYLGEDLPEESIADAAKATKSDVVLMAFSPAYVSRNKNINDVCYTMRKLLPTDTEIWVGGSVSNLNMSTMRDARVTTFSHLEMLDQKLGELSKKVKS